MLMSAITFILQVVTILVALQVLLKFIERVSARWSAQTHPTCHNCCAEHPMTAAAFCALDGEDQLVFVRCTLCGKIMIPEFEVLPHCRKQRHYDDWASKKKAHGSSFNTAWVAETQKEET